MVASEHRSWLRLTVPLYFALLFGAAYWAYHRTESLHRANVSDKLNAHFLGGRALGPVLTAGTLFASVYSGYTVIGVPNDAYSRGFLSGKWILNVIGNITAYYGTGIRLKRTSQYRNHQSPVDFVTDRHQSQLLRYMVVFLQVIPTLIYLSAQVVAIKSTFNSVFELDADSTYPAILIMGLILAFEWVGGLNSVALTDCVQAVVMSVSFITIPAILLKHFGGWRDLDPETYPRPEYYQTLSTADQWEFWQFSIVNLSFFTLPHLMQRTYAARSPASLKIGYGFMTLSPWLTTLIGVAMGTIGVSILADEDGNPTSPPNAFAAILEEIMDLGTFPEIAGSVAFTAALAATMSTADSLTIAISQLVTVEVVFPLSPHMSASEITFLGKFVSLVAAAVAMLIGILWDEGLSDMTAIQFSVSAQAVPAFLFGLFSTGKRTEIHPWCLFVGALASTAYVIGIYFGYLKPDEDAKSVHAGITGFCINVFVCVSLELIRRVTGGVMAVEDNTEVIEMEKGEELIYVQYPGRPKWDVPSQARFGGSCLTPGKVWHGMEGINEPFSHPLWWFTMFFVITMACPWTAASEPPLAPPDSETTFLYPPSVINGLPWWFVKVLIIAIIATLLLITAISRIPDEFPEYKEKSTVIEKEEEEERMECSPDANPADDEST